MRGGIGHATQEEYKKRIVEGQKRWIVPVEMKIGTFFSFFLYYNYHSLIIIHFPRLAS